MGHRTSRGPISGEQCLPQHTCSEVIDTGHAAAGVTCAGSEDDQEFHARQVYPEPAQTQAVQAPQYQLQHPQQQPQPQQQLGAFQQYLSLPYYQQLQQGAQQAAQRPPEVGPLGQAFLSAQQQTTRTVQAQQSHAVFTPQQQQQQQQQQPKQQPWTAAGVAYTLQQQQHLYGQQAVQQGQSLHAGHTIVG